MANCKFISYLPVSTTKQAASGLGLEAQRETVARYLNGGKWDLVEEVVEVESGRKNQRPSLEKAIRLYNAIGATLVVAKFDRLSRDAHFLLGLKKSGVKPVCQSWLMAVVLSLNSFAALITIKAGLVIRSCAFNIRYVEASDTK